jgi:hypothetical protein
MGQGQVEIELALTFNQSIGNGTLGLLRSYKG